MNIGKTQKKGRFLQGWPLHNSGAISPKDDPHVAVIAAKRQRTPTQVLLRWALQHGAAVIPTSRTHSADNAAVFDFVLSDEEMATISGLSWFMEGEVRKRLLSHLYIKCIILPRQARDKHRESSKKGARFVEGEHSAVCGCAWC
jgi:hypothetical protein|eukprot:COSAG06_NODE_3465_length_5300_cov_1.806960_3_plen_144_part_00